MGVETKRVSNYAYNDIYAVEAGHIPQQRK